MKKVNKNILINIQLLKASSVYQSHYATFCDWCTQKGISMESVSVQIIADYLYYMFDNLGRKVATISNHRTALSAALGEFDGFTIGNHPILTSLINTIC